MQKAADQPARPHVSRLRLERINEIHRLMGLGKRTITEIVAEKKGERGWSYRNVEKLMASPEMEAVRQQLRDGQEDFVTGLVGRQVYQIEHGGLQPGAQLAFRAGVIAMYKPRDVKISGAVKQEIEVKQDVDEDQLATYIPVIADMVMAEQARRANAPDDAENPQEPVAPP